MAGLEQYTTYDQKLQLLNTIIEGGIEKLLKEAENNDILDAPYGRRPEPTPLISESDWENELQASLDGGMTIGQIPETAPQCEFTYGFDALQFFSQFIDWSHPVNIEKRHQEKLAASKALHYRTQHAKAQLSCADSLRTTVEQQSSGILWGPFTTPLSHSSVLIIVKPLKLGTIITQVSETTDFTGESVTSLISKVASEKSIRTDGSGEDIKLEDIVAVKEHLHDLKAGCRYYIRCCLQESPSAPCFVGLEGTHYQSSHFTTLPTDDDPNEEEVPTEVVPAVSLMCFGNMLTDKVKISTASSSGSSYSSNSEGSPASYVTETTVPTPVVHCLVGDILGSSFNAIDTTRQLTDKQQLSERISKLFSSNGLFNTSSSIFRGSSLLIGWRDSSPAGSQHIRHEEAVCKQYQKELKKYQKKYNIGGGKKSKKASVGAVAVAPPPPPLLSRPPLPAAFQSIVESFPSEFNASTMDILATADPASLKTSSMLYRSVMLGPDVQVFMLDIRDSGSSMANECSFLGKNQAGWLYASLEDSPATWKVILCGKSFGIVTFLSDNSVTGVMEASMEKSNAGDKSLNQEESPRGAVSEGEEGLIEPSQLMTGISLEDPPMQGDEGDDEQKTVDGDSHSPQTARDPTEGTSQEPSPVQKKGVQMIVPEKSPVQEEEEDLDAMGRSKYSLQYVLSTLQISKYRPADVGTTSIESVVSLEGSSQASVSVAPSLADGGVSINPQEDRVEESSVVILESGIVLLTTANIVAPGEYTTVLTKPQPAVPSFICTYSDLHATNNISTDGSHGDDVNAGNSQVANPNSAIFCAEVSIGAGGTADAADAASESDSSITHKVLEGMDCSIMYCTNPSSECVSGGNAEALANYSAEAIPTCQLSLLPDGNLQVQLLYVPPNQEEKLDGDKGTVKGAVVFECKFQAQASQSTDEQD